MARSAIDMVNEKGDPVLVRTLDARLADLLGAIERERVPERLLVLARDLQAELLSRKQSRDPN